MYKLLNHHTPARFEPTIYGSGGRDVGSSVPERDAMSTAPRRPREQWGFCFTRWEQGCQIFRGTIYQNGEIYALYHNILNISPQNWPKCNKNYKMTGNLPILSKFSFTRIFRCKTLQNLPKSGFWVWKYTIWQPWVRAENRPPMLSRFFSIAKYNPEPICSSSCHYNFYILSKIENLKIQLQFCKKGSVFLMWGLTQLARKR
jgi:hypothetical protein